MKYFILACILFVLTSCNTLKPIYKDISAADYNSRTTVRGAGYIKKSNAVGWSFQIAGPIAGAYAGYESDLIQIPDGDSPKSVPIANAAIGAIIGYSIPFTLNLLGGKNKKSNVLNVEQWVKKKCPNYLVLKEISNSNFVIIPKSVEPNFKVRNIQDVRDFVYLFPKSKHKDDIFSKSVINLKRYDLPELISLIPNTKYLNEAKIKYYNYSSNVTQLKDAIRKYPSQKKDCNDCGIINNLYLTASKGDLIYLAKEFPSSNCINNLYDELISQTKTVDELSELVYQFPNIKSIASVRASSLAITVDDCLKLFKEFPERKEEISKKAFELSGTFSDYKKVYDNFPAYVDKVEKKVISIAGNDMSKLSLVYEKFTPISLIAENRAYKLITSLESKKEFIKYFPDGIFSSQVEKEIILEERDIKNFKSIVSKSVYNTSEKYYEMFDNYSGGISNSEMVSYKYDDDCVRLSVEIKLDFYVIFEDNDGEKKLAGLFNIFSKASSRPARTATIKYDILLYKDKPSKIVNYDELGIASLEGAQRGINSLKGEFNDFLTSLAETSNDGSYDYYDNNRNEPCYIILDDYGYLIDNTKRYYKIKCRDGKEWTINYNSKSSEPYTKGNLDGIFFSYKTFQQAAKAACGCQ